jgi:hypothetical protein
MGRLASQSRGLRRDRWIAAMMLLLAAAPLPGCTNHGREFHPEYALGTAAFIGIGMFVPGVYDDSPPPTAEQQINDFYGAGRPRW